MTPIRKVIQRRPAFFTGQLLTKENFEAEQNYHRDARSKHNLRLHSWGVVDGLTVSQTGPTTISVAPGLAIDELGRELLLQGPESLDLTGFGASQTAYISVSYAEGEVEFRKFEYGEGHAFREEYCVLQAASKPETEAPIVLAYVKFDDKGKINSIDYSQTHYSSPRLAPGSVGTRELADGSVTQSKLDEGLRSGWVRMPFKPFPMSRLDPANQKTDQRTPFLIGATSAVSTDQGAAGSIAVPVPPGMTLVTKLRIAGRMNKGNIQVQLFRFGWDPEKKITLKQTLLDQQFEGPTDDFQHTVDVAGRLDPQYEALSLVIMTTKEASISLVAIQFGHGG